VVDLALHTLHTRASITLGYELNGINSCGLSESSHLNNIEPTLPALTLRHKRPRFPETRRYLDPVTARHQIRIPWDKNKIGFIQILRSYRRLAVMEIGSASPTCGGKPEASVSALGPPHPSLRCNGEPCQRVMQGLSDQPDEPLLFSKSEENRNSRKANLVVFCHRRWSLIPHTAQRPAIRSRHRVVDLISLVLAGRANSYAQMESGALIGRI
jgi:hypothetical protein